MHLGEIIDSLKKATHVLISAHTNPDGDAIGAMVAMGHFCENLKIPYTILLEEAVPRFEYLTKHVHTATEVSEPIDTMLALDCGDVSRVVGYEAYFTKASITVSIDHHITNTAYAQYNYVKPEASSTSELVFDLIEAADVVLTKELAIALYTGILTDTGGFMHSCTSPRTLQIAAKLIEKDFNFSSLYHKLIHEKSLATIALQGRATNHLKQIREGIFMTYITEQDMSEVGATKEDIDSIVSFLKTIQGIEMIAFLYPLGTGDGFKLSTRSNPPYNVAAFCQQFGGGGHERASGATLKMPLEQAIQKIENALTEMV